MTDYEIIDHIEQEKENHPVQMMCEVLEVLEVLEVPRSTYYQSFKKVPSSYEIENEVILERIKSFMRRVKTAMAHRKSIIF